MAALSEAQFYEIRNIFRFLDTDKDGYITLPQALTAWRLLGVVPTPAMRNEFATSPLGVSMNRFMEVMSNDIADSSLEGTIKRSFTLVDRTDHGKLTQEDLTRFFDSMGEHFDPAVVRDLVERMGNDDGTISFDEFDTFIRRHGDGVLF
ncbi:hypothetical protein PAPYR_6126 [Paratrimastix pyriformis]|uniref:EF-hand domain-containing protein n=1 Tax=Paratrimastix pyriformis TaxID=342808 RepID=A0ABQ8UFX0_9EUKA|nr:hypothetical protein PAPYR_6126 [Paratrimastix pyriformis]